ncbi:MAG: mitofilin family membrane protein [Caulobacterales bacterium]
MSQASAEQSSGASYARAEPIDVEYRRVGRDGPGWGAIAGLVVLAIVLGGALGVGLSRLFEMPTEQRMAAAEGRLADLDKIATEESKRVKNAIAVETASLRADVEVLKDAASRGEGGFNAAMSPSAIFAVQSVIEQARAGQPFGEAYLALAATLPDDPNVKALEAYANTGAPTLTTLKVNFTDAELAVTRATSTNKPTGATAAAQSLLSRFVTVRKSDVAAMTPTEAAMSRAADRLKGDDLAGAVEDISTLTGAGAKAAKPWLTQAQARLAVDDAIGALKVRLDRARKA